MPLVEKSTYSPPLLLRNAHLQTILPTLARKVNGINYQRERIKTPDDDFLDLDWSAKGFSKVCVLCHGLESSSGEPYMKGMVRALNRRNWDAVAINFRGCSGEPNRRLRTYHSGATDDLQTVVDHIQNLGRYDEIALIGFSLGGNLVLKYVGEQGAGISDRITRAAAVSVPCDLESCSQRMTERKNGIYMRRFIKKLIRKMEHKCRLAEAPFRLEQFLSMKTFKEFDDLYTGPVHGFKDAVDYWTRCSCRQFLHRIKIPTLLINAVDDPFLSEQCYPVGEAKESELFYLERPAHGGHVGFMTFDSKGEYWHEGQVADFVTRGRGLLTPASRHQD